MSGKLIARLAGLAFLAAFLLSPSAHAAFPGENGKIAFERSGAIWTINPDGSGETQITTGTPPDARPAWSPDGTKIAFQRSGAIWTANPDGSGPALAITNARSPAWSPNGQQIAFIPGDSDSVWKANADGTGRTHVFGPPDSEYFGLDAPAWSPHGNTIALDTEDYAEIWCDPIENECYNTIRHRIGTVFASAPNHVLRELPYGMAPNWSPDGHKLAFHTVGELTDEPAGRIGTMNPDGSDRHVPSPSGNDSEAAWSPDGTRLTFQRSNALMVMNADGTGATAIGGIGVRPDWQPLPVNTPSTYPRPKGASPLYLSLVTAFEPCTAPNREHGPPLAFASCNPPDPSSSSRLISAGDARLRSIGFLRARVDAGVPGGADDTDVHLRFSLTNVLNASNLGDYTGQLLPRVTVRRTDREGPIASTTQDFPLSWVVPCAATADPDIGGACALDTTLDALVPGAAAEGTRAIWALDALRVYDTGPDNSAGTTHDNTLFLTQGVFVP